MSILSEFQLKMSLSKIYDRKSSSIVKIKITNPNQVSASHTHPLPIFHLFRQQRLYVLTLHPFPSILCFSWHLKHKTGVKSVTHLPGLLLEEHRYWFLRILHWFRKPCFICYLVWLLPQSEFSNPSYQSIMPSLCFKAPWSLLCLALYFLRFSPFYLSSIQITILTCNL